MNPQKHIFLWNASYIAGSPRHFSVIIHRHSEVDVLPSVLGTWIFGRCHCSNLEANMFPAGKGENASQVRTISKTALQKDGQEVMPSPTLSFREEENPKTPNFLAFVVELLILTTLLFVQALCLWFLDYHGNMCMYLFRFHPILLASGMVSML